LMSLRLFTRRHLKPNVELSGAKRQAAQRQK
jgi:hypothetical protein